MSKFKKAFIFIFIIVFIFIGISCKDNNIDDNNKEEVTYHIYGFNNLEVGNMMNVTSDYNEAIFYSSNEDIASCSKDGLVTAFDKGSCEIYFIYNDNKIKLDLEVTYPKINLDIIGKTEIKVNEETTYFVEFKDLENEPVYTFDIENKDVATIDENGIVKGLKAGSTKIIVRCWDQEFSYDISVIEEVSFEIIFASFPQNMYIGDSFEVKLAENEAINPNLVRLYTDSEIIDIKGFTIMANNIGNADIYAIYDENPDTIKKFSVNIIVPPSPSIEVTGKDTIFSGEVSKLSVKINNPKPLWMVEISISNEMVARFVDSDNIVGLKPGEVDINIKYVNYYSDIKDTYISETFHLTVCEYKQMGDFCVADYMRVEGIMENMTIEEKIGQMFLTGFSGTTFSSTLSNAISTYHFGNIIFMGENVSDPNKISKLSNDIQNKMMEVNGVPAFIATDQEGGTVARIKIGGTHFISQMGMGATGDYNNTYLQGLATGAELRNYGINTDFAPVVDVNNNPNNSVIGVRSYSDDPVKVGMYANGLISGLKTSGVMACSKHFPGHGNTETDSHYGLPIINSTLDEIYSTELVPYYMAIYNGINAIMSAHIIFNAIDPDNPATLSYKVLTELLRNELGYSGVIYTDSMIMNAITNNFGTYGECAVKAVLAGVDILTYTGLSQATDGIIGVLGAYNNGVITEERINASVRRILLMKLQYGLLDNYLAKDEDITELLENNANLNLEFAKDSLTLVGSIDNLDMTKKTLVISPTSSYTLPYSTDNSIGSSCSGYFKQLGNNNVDYLTVNNKITSNDKNKVNEIINNYDNIILCFNNIQKSNYTATSNYVNEILNKYQDKYILVVSLGSPYDFMLYNDNINYVCLYGYQDVNALAFAMFINREFEATGVASVEIKK